MKKFLVVLVVVAMALMSSMAFAAAEVTVGGSVDVRSRAFTNLDLNGDTPANSDRYTQERIRLNVDAKAGDAKAKITLENDWNKWGSATDGVTNLGIGGAGAVESKQIDANGTPGLGFREAWLDTPIVGALHLKAGHQFLQLGNGWFLRNMKYGDDAWLAYAGLDTLTVALADAKIAERSNDRDSDFYAGLAVLKLGDLGTVGADASHVVLAKKQYPTAAAGGNVLDNLGLNTNLNLGLVKLQGELDLQMGKDKTNTATVSKYKGNQVVFQGTVPMDKVAINFTAARGTGDDYNSTSNDTKTMIPVLDTDPHYTVAYEYLIGQSLAGKFASGNAVGAHWGFANTTALSAGADVTLGSVTLGANFWYLQATKKISQDTTNVLLPASNNLGMEVDGRVNWKLSDAVSWNWNLAYFLPGDAYKTTDAVTGGVKNPDNATVIQGVLSMKF